MINIKTLTQRQRFSNTFQNFIYLPMVFELGCKQFVQYLIENNQMRVEIALIIILSFALVAQATTEVDNLNLLLPELKDSSLQLPLQLITAQGACYLWSSSVPEVLSVSLHDQKSSTCSKQALVKVVQPGPYSSSIYVTASDAATDAILNVPVRIRKLSKVFIATKSRMMNLKEIQKLELFAQDSEENTFTSLEGLRFTWTLEQKSKIIETVPLASAQLYLPLRTRQNLQKQGYQSDILVVRALAPGNLKIHVKCNEPGYEHLRDQITLSVHERFELKPGPVVRMMQSSTYQFRLQRPNSQVIILPQPYYNVISCIGFKINSTLHLNVQDWSEKECEIKIEDTRTIPPYSSTVKVIVDNPVDLRIVSNPLIIIGQRSPFQIQYFNAQHQPIYGVPKNLNIESDFDINLWSGTVQSSKKQVGWIRASLGSLRSNLQITSLLPIAPILPSNYLHLPLNEVFKLRMVGGSGLFDFNINNDIASVNSQGVIVSKGVGEGKIKVSDRNYPSNKVIIDLKVSQLAEISSLQQQKEANKDEWSNVYIIGRSKSGQTYTQCLSSEYSLTLPSHKLQIDKKNNFTQSIRFLSNHPSRLVQQALSPTSLLKGKAQEVIARFNIYVDSREIEKVDLRTYISSLQKYGICQVIKFRSSSAFQDRAVISLVGKDEKVETKLPLRIYEPLSTTIKEDTTTFLLTPLSTITWDYVGGSYPWTNSQTKIAINDARVKSNTKPSIVCPDTEKDISQYNLKIQNEQTTSLLFPTYQTAQINVACKFPKKLQLQLQKGDFFEDLLINPNTQISGYVQPVDETGSPFYNATNVQYTFIASNGVIQAKDTSFKYTANKRADKVRIYTDALKPKIGFRRAQVQFDVSVVEPVKVNHLLSQSAKQSKTQDLKRYIQIVTLYTPKKPYVFSLVNANQLIDIKCTQSVSCDKDGEKVQVNLDKIGKGLVSIKDKRVYGSIEWIYQFTIVEAQQIKVEGTQSDIAQGESVNVTINMLYNGQVISPLLYQHNHQELVMDKNLRVLEHHQNKFLISANAAGNYQIHGEQTYPKTLRSVVPFTLNVYERIEPDISNIASRKEGKVYIIQGETALVFGCKRILRVKGGPKSIQVTPEHDRQLIVSRQSYNTFSIMSEREGTYNLKLIVKNNGEIVTICQLKVVVSKVQSVELTSIVEPVVEAQFRIIPKFKVGKSQIQGCVCDFDFKWSTKKGLVSLGHSSSLGFLHGGGINATALKEGDDKIILQIQDKVTRKIIGQTQRSIKILRQIDVNLPTIIGKPYSRTQILRISPLTSYEFGQEYTVQGPEDLIKISSSGTIQSYKKLGHTTIKLLRSGHAPRIVEIEVGQIQGVFIENEEGSLSVQPTQTRQVPIYFYDKNGYLFVSPMKNLQVQVSSSNPDVLKASLSPSHQSIVLQGVSIGSSELSVSLNGRDIYDSIAVSVGSLIQPSSEVRVLKNGVIKFRAPNNQGGKWKSSDPNIVQINERTGEAHTHQVGRSKITNGNLFGWVTVTLVSTIQQLNFTQIEQGQYRIIYRALWQGRKGQEEIPNFNSAGSVNNNFNPKCRIQPSKWFSVTSEIKLESGYERLHCIVKVIGSITAKGFPDAYSISVVDGQGNKLHTFHYPSEYGFLIDGGKTRLSLSSAHPRQEINIRTRSNLFVHVPTEYRKWVASTFNEENRIQTISLDMGGWKEDKTWVFQLSNGEQKQSFSISYKFTGEQAGGSSLDWPEYLIIIMAVVFGGLCVVQYYSESKKEKFG